MQLWDGLVEMLPAGVDARVLIRQLRAAGARFAYLHGSRVSGRPRQDSDVDVAVWFGRPVDSWRVEVPNRVDLLVLDSAPDELSGRVAQHGVLLFEDDQEARVRWQATASKRYLDDAARRRQIRDDVLGVT